MTAAANGGVVSGSGRLVSPGSASALRGTQPGPEKIATGLDKNTFIEGWSLSSPRCRVRNSANGWFVLHELPTPPRPRHDSRRRLGLVVVVHCQQPQSTDHARLLGE